MVLTKTAKDSSQQYGSGIGKDIVDDVELSKRRIKKISVESSCPERPMFGYRDIDRLYRDVLHCGWNTESLDPAFY